MASPFSNSHLMGMGSADSGMAMMGLPLPGGVLSMGGAARGLAGGAPGANWTQGLESGNLTGLYQVFSNMTAGEFINSLQSVFLAALVRQYLFNDFFAGGVGLMLVGLVGSQAQRLYGWLLAALAARPQGKVQVRLERGSEAYTWLQDWLRQHSKLSSTNYDVESYWEDDDDSACTGHSESEDSDKPKIRLLPEFKEAQCVVYQGEQVWVQSKSSFFAPGGGGGGDHGGEGGGGGGILALLQRSGNAKGDLVMSGPSSELLRRLLEEAMAAHMSARAVEPVTEVLRWSCEEMYWNHLGDMKARPLDSVVLDCDAGLLLEDAKRFMASAAWYSDRGIPHRRGYLLHGPPGCGKTSLIKAVAGELKLGVSLISLSARELTDDTLGSAMSRLPHRSIFVLEDVDAAFAKNPQGGGSAGLGPGEEGGGARVGTMRNGLSFSGLLNAIDGIAAQEGRIVIMTTNHIERLDPALIRPGRIDLRLFLGLTSSAQLRGIFRRFYPDATAEDEEAVVRGIPPGLLSPASIQGFFLLHRDDVAAMRQGLPAFVAQAGREANSQAGRESDGQAGREPDAQAGTESDGQAGREPDGQAGASASASESDVTTEERGDAEGEGENVGGEGKWWSKALRRRRKGRGKGR